jgi:hypothetical protein
MTPTLWGRWQTRFLQLNTIGLAVTLLFGHFVTMPDYQTPLAVLGYVLVFGLGFDWIYTLLTRLRWDRDWPPIFQLGAGLWEAMFVWGIAQALPAWQPFGWSHLPGVAAELPFSLFAGHYTSVWIMTFLASQGLLRIIFPRWRFYGGEWV